MVTRVELQPARRCLRLCVSEVDPMLRWLVVARERRRAPHQSSREAGGLPELSQLEGNVNLTRSFNKWLGMIIADVLPSFCTSGCLQIVSGHHELSGSSSRYLVDSRHRCAVKHQYVRREHAHRSVGTLSTVQERAAVRARAS